MFRTHIRGMRNAARSGSIARFTSPDLHRIGSWLDADTRLSLPAAHPHLPCRSSAHRTGAALRGTCSLVDQSCTWENGRSVTVLRANAGRHDAVCDGGGRMLAESFANEGFRFDEDGSNDVTTGDRDGPTR